VANGETISSEASAGLAPAPKHRKRRPDGRQHRNRTMSKNQERREVSSGRASAEAARRFKGSLRREVGDLEVRLEEAQLRSDAYLHAGLTSEANQVIEESLEMVETFHRSLNDALAQAAVEREAEQIFASSVDVLGVLGEGETTSGGILARVPAGIGAALASVAVLAMAVITMRPAADDRAVRQVADVSALPDQVALPAPTRVAPSTTDRLILSLSPMDRAVIGAASVDREAAAPLLAKRRQLLARFASPGVITSAMLTELDAVVQMLRSEGVDVERLVELERVAARAEADAQESSERQPESAPEAPDEQPDPAAEPAPAAEPDPAAEPTDEPSEDGGVFDGFDEDPEDESESEAEASGSSSGDKDGDDGLLGD
jgi:hypothetical protein